MAGPKIHITVDDSVLRKMIADTKGPIEPKVVADGVNYGLFNEWGTSKMTAVPFMRPAVEAVRPGFNKAMHQAWRSVSLMQSVVDKTAFDVERGAKQRAPVDTGALRNSIHVVSGDKFDVTFEQVARKWETVT